MREVKIKVGKTKRGQQKEQQNYDATRYKPTKTETARINCRIIFVRAPLQIVNEALWCPTCRRTIDNQMQDLRLRIIFLLFVLWRNKNECQFAHVFFFVFLTPSQIDKVEAN